MMVLLWSQQVGIVLESKSEDKDSSSVCLWPDVGPGTSSFASNGKRKVWCVWILKSLSKQKGIWNRSLFHKPALPAVHTTWSSAALTVKWEHRLKGFAFPFASEPRRHHGPSTDRMHSPALSIWPCPEFLVTWTACYFTFFSVFTWESVSDRKELQVRVARRREQSQGWEGRHSGAASFLGLKWERRLEGKLTRGTLKYCSART